MRMSAWPRTGSARRHGRRPHLRPNRCGRRTGSGGASWTSKGEGRGSPLIQVTEYNLLCNSLLYIRYDEEDEQILKLDAMGGLEADEEQRRREETRRKLEAGERREGYRRGDR